tara:strand:- start:303 stop:422 length:120 start_codon:yes stop_codon:yes gene_type:complete
VVKEKIINRPTTNSPTLKDKILSPEKDLPKIIKKDNPRI